MNNAPPISRRRLAALVAVTGALALLALCIAIASETVANAASSAAPSAACVVDYTVESSSHTGFQARIEITNDGAALGSWSLQYSYDGSATLADGRGAAWSQSGAQVTAAGGRNDDALASGDSTSISASFGVSGKAGTPTGFTLDGAPCTGKVEVPASPAD
jgi:cellulase/cellobiase CelA1